MNLTEYSSTFNQYQAKLPEISPLVFDNESMGKGFALFESNTLLMEFRLDEQNNIIYIEADSTLLDFIVDDDDNKKIAAITRETSALIASFKTGADTEHIKLIHTSVWDAYKEALKNYIAHDHFRGEAGFRIDWLWVSISMSYKLNYRVTIEVC